MRRAVLSCLVLVAALLVSTSPAQAATITVTTTADVVNGADGLTSLREAVSTANAAATPTTITLAASASYGLNLCGDNDTNASGDLDSTSAQPLTVDGNASTIDQNCAGERVLDALDSDGSIALQAVTLTGGDDVDGAALRHNGDASLTDSTATGNNAGTGRVLASSLGGGVLDLTDSSISDNTGTGVGAVTGHSAPHRYDGREQHRSRGRSDRRSAHGDRLDDQRQRRRRRTDHWAGLWSVHSY